MTAMVQYLLDCIYMTAVYVGLSLGDQSGLFYILDFIIELSNDRHSQD